MANEQSTVTVLTARYSDGSGFRVVRVYGDEQRAREDLALVKNDCAEVYELHDVPFFGGLTHAD